MNFRVVTFDSKVVSEFTTYLEARDFILDLTHSQVKRHWIEGKINNEWYGVNLNETMLYV